MKDYGLDLHCQMILEEYENYHERFNKLMAVVIKVLKDQLRKNGILVTAIEGRVKTEASLAGKLELKGAKYKSIKDITDIVGIRIITFYSEDVDKISALAEQKFKVDWENSVDKRKMHALNSFGYMSLHYICRLTEELLPEGEDDPALLKIPFELQMRTALQHVWANMYHDTGYKSGVEVPEDLLRGLNRLAGMLELADGEFSRIRSSVTDYRREINKLVQSGRLDDVSLSADTFRSYLALLKPFDKLNKKIAAINQAEIQEHTLMPFFQILKNLGFSTLGDVDRLVKNYSDDAYTLALHEIGGTDLDIISSTVAIQDICIVWILENGGTIDNLSSFFESLNGPNPYNRTRAERVYQKALSLSLVKQNTNTSENV